MSTAHKDGTKYVSGVTYGGAPLSIRMSAGSSNNSAAIYYMVIPPVGTATVQVTMTGSVNLAASATTFTGVDQVTPFSPGAAAVGTATTASVSLMSQVGEVVLSAIAANSDANSLTRIGTGTDLWSDGSGGGKTQIRGAAATRPGGGYVTVGWTLAAGKSWGLVATTLRPGQAPFSVPSTTHT